MPDQPSFSLVEGIHRLIKQWESAAKRIDYDAGEQTCGDWVRICAKELAALLAAYAEGTPKP